MANRTQPRIKLHSSRLQAVAALAGLCLAACSTSNALEPLADAGTAAALDSGDATPHARIYATVAGNDEVMVIDEVTHKTLSKIAVGQGPAIILATPDQSKLYTANWADNTVSVIDVESEEATNLDMPGRPYVIAMAPAGDVVYAGLSPRDIAVINTATDKVDRFIKTPDLPASIIVSADGKTLYVAVVAGNIRGISAETGEVTQPALSVGLAPAWITASPNGKQVFTLNFLTDNVSVVNTETWTVDATVSTGSGSQAIIGNVTPDNTTLYVTNHGTGELMAIDAATHEVTDTIALDGRPVGVNFNHDGSRVYVTDFGPASLDAPADTNYLLAGKFTGTEAGQISIFDTKTGKPVGKKVVTGPGPTSLVILE